MPTVIITDRPMLLDELMAVVDGAPVRLADSVRVRIAEARTVVDRALADDAAVYGLITQVGHAKDTWLIVEQIRGEQLFLIMSYVGGMGEPLSVRGVRAVLIVCLNGLARGGSGVSPAAADVLVALLNRGVHSIVSSMGSVGAGDLGQLAFAVQVAVGRGRAEYRGEILPGGEALDRAGIQALVLIGKDGLVFISSNAVSIGHAVLVVVRAQRMIRLSDLAAVVTMEAIGANSSILYSVVAGVIGMTGQREAADHLRELLAGGLLLEPASDHSVQDALFFRVVSQVHGALR